MKTPLFILALIASLSCTAQFQLFDFDTKTEDISKLEYITFQRKLADDTGKYYRPEEINFPEKPQIVITTFDDNGHLLSRKDDFNDVVYSYPADYGTITSEYRNTGKTHVNNLIKIGRRVVFAKDMGTLEKDNQNRIIKINNIKNPSDATQIDYQGNNTTVKSLYSNRTFNQEGKEILNTLGGSKEYKYYKDNGAIEFSAFINYTYVSHFYFYTYEYDAKGNWTKRIKFEYTTGFDNKDWRLHEIVYRKITYKNNSVSEPKIDVATDRTKYMQLATTLPTVEYNPHKNGYDAYIGKTDLQNLKTPVKNEIQEEKTIVTTDSCLAGDCKDGLGRKMIDNSKVEAIFSKSRLNSFGIQVFDTGTYQGEFIGGKRDGYGTYTWNDTEKIHIGTWKNGAQDGFGIVLQGDKVTQAGEYAAGKHTLNYLKPYESGVKNRNCIGNCSDGFGKITFDNGDWYLGFFKQGQFYKLGIYHFKNANSNYWGTYENGKMHGGGHYFTSEYTYIGNFENGNFNGKAIKRMTSGTSEAGRYENGAQVISYGKLD